MKFKQNIEQILIKFNKIDYIKNHYKETIFDIIKIRLNINYYNLYKIVNKLILKLNIIFEIYDKIVKSNIQFHNFNFDMNIHNKREIFKSFYIYFITIIAFLNYINILKIFNLKRLIAIRLKYRILRKNFFFYRDFIARLYYIIADLKIINKITLFKDKNKIENV